MTNCRKSRWAIAIGAAVALLLWPDLPASVSARAVTSQLTVSKAIRPGVGTTLAKDAFYNEVQAQLRDHSLWCYQETKQENGQKKLYGVCQAQGGEIDRLLAVNSSRLDTAQQHAEDQRIRSLLADPRELRRQQRKQEQDDEQTRNLMRVFGQAFRFQYVSAENGLAEVRFAPDPNFHPSSRAERVFHHLQGTLFINQRQQRIAEIDGLLTSEVKFLGGLLGHLDAGGTFQVQQKDLGSGHWELTRLHVQMTGKALIFHTVSVQEDETYSDFREEPEDTSMQQAFEELQREAPLDDAQRR